MSQVWIAAREMSFFQCQSKRLHRVLLRKTFGVWWLDEIVWWDSIMNFRMKNEVDFNSVLHVCYIKGQSQAFSNLLPLVREVLRKKQRLSVVRWERPLLERLNGVFFVCKSLIWMALWIYQFVLEKSKLQDEKLICKLSGTAGREKMDHPTKNVIRYLKKVEKARGPKGIELRGPTNGWSSRRRTVFLRLQV